MLKRLQSCFLSEVDKRCEVAVAPKKHSLLNSLSGHIFEIGPGPGINFCYYQNGIQWTGVEPNASLHPRIYEQASHYGISCQLRELKNGGAYDIADSSQDAAVSMFALCTVDDPAATLKDIMRILKPGGTFVFLEHVGGAQGSWLRKTQDIVQPVWGRIAEGCRLNCDSFPIIEQAGFEGLQHDKFSIPVPILSPHISGICRKPVAV